MAVVVLVSRESGRYSRAPEFYDNSLQTGGILVNQDNYDITLDRIYDMRGLANAHVKITNTGGANGLVYKIENTRTNYTDISTLVDADFDGEILGDTTITFGITDVNDIIDLSPETTALRIRVKRETASLDTTVQGIFSAN